MYKLEQDKLEQIARLICLADNNNPDTKEDVGGGEMMSLWEMYIMDASFFVNDPSLIDKVREVLNESVS